MKDDKLYRIHISECIEKIEQYLNGVDLTAFHKETLLQDAVLRNLQVLAESTQRLSDDFKQHHKEIEWYKIAGLRNILVHDYLGIDLDTVWNIIQNELPTLRGKVSL
jgi:uncharacterized protein with HEPN domain